MDRMSWWDSAQAGSVDIDIWEISLKLKGLPNLQLISTTATGLFTSCLSQQSCPVLVHKLRSITLCWLTSFSLLGSFEVPNFPGGLACWIFESSKSYSISKMALFSNNRLWLPFRGHHRCGKVHPKKIKKKKHRCELVWRTQGSPQLDSVENYMHHASSCMFQSLNHNLPWFMIPAWVKSSRKSHLENHMMFWAFFRSPRVGNVGGHLIKPVIRMFNGNQKKSWRRCPHQARRLSANCSLCASFPPPTQQKKTIDPSH